MHITADTLYNTHSLDLEAIDHPFIIEQLGTRTNNIGWHFFRLAYM